MARHSDVDGDGVADQGEVFTAEDGAVYRRVDPGEFEPFDEIDSRSIVDPGAPDENPPEDDEGGH